MQAYPGKKGCINPACFLTYLLGFALFIVSNICLAGTIVITGNTVINKSTKYNNAVLDMTNGRFTIKSFSTLTISNSTINITISPGNPFFSFLSNGNVSLNNNTFNVTVAGINPDPNNKSIYQLVQVQQGNAAIMNNVFTVGTPFTLGFLDTLGLTTSGFNISGNTISNFHGGIYLTNSNQATIANNTFQNVSFANIYNIGNSSTFNNNLFSFPGNLDSGDAIDIVNSNGVDITDNIIGSSSGYGIYILGGQSLNITNNQVTDGSSYAVYIDTPSMSALKKAKFRNKTIDHQRINFLDNSDITINNNYFSQNRYGLTGGVIDKLTVTSNVFIQRFLDAASRQHWTNNTVLLPSATNVTWTGNLYKEAFTQDVPGDNSNTLMFVPFPQQGGVVLP